MERESSGYAYKQDKGRKLKNTQWKGPSIRPCVCVCVQSGFLKVSDLQSQTALSHSVLCNTVKWLMIIGVGRMLLKALLAQNREGQRSMAVNRKFHTNTVLLCFLN